MHRQTEWKACDLFYTHGNCGVDEKGEQAPERIAFEAHCPQGTGAPFFV